jgi:hypothetical protein
MDILRIFSSCMTTGWLSVERVAPDARLPAVSRFPTSPARWETCSMPTPLSAHPQWGDVDGSHIALFCWVEQVMEDPELRMLPAGLHQRGQVVGRGLDSLYVCFADNVLLSVPSHVLRLLPDAPDEC